MRETPMSGGQEFKVWAMGDAHVAADLKGGRESLADPIRQSEFGGKDGGPAFDWDIGINVGDYSGEVGLPTDAEGQEVVRQFSVMQKHARESIYSLCGNHDRNGLNEPDGYWFRKWIDPLGENPETSGVRRERIPFPVTGTWERYSFEVGNVLFLMMSDVNEDSRSEGRGDLGGNPGGVVRQETFDWWVDQVASNQDKIIVTAHHYVLKDTTVASGEWEGMRKDADGRWVMNYHGSYERGTPNGASYLYWVGGKPDSGSFERVLAENPGCVDLWLGGHTHAKPDDTTGNKSKIETKWGTTFMNVCPLTRYFVQEHARPHSRLLTFKEGSDEVRLQCYMHTNEYKNEGWYHEAERTVKLKRPFQRA
jgi:hypothetical protein